MRDDLGRGLITALIYPKLLRFAVNTEEALEFAKYFQRPKRWPRLPPRDHWHVLACWKALLDDAFRFGPRDSQKRWFTAQPSRLPWGQS